MVDTHFMEVAPAARDLCIDVIDLAGTRESGHVSTPII
jgi:hypothetical protein